MWCVTYELQTVKWRKKNELKFVFSIMRRITLLLCSIVCSKSHITLQQHLASGFERNFMRDVWIFTMMKLVFVLIIGWRRCEEQKGNNVEIYWALWCWGCKANCGRWKTHLCNPKALDFESSATADACTVNIYTLLKPSSQTAVRLRNSN